MRETSRRLQEIRIFHKPYVNFAQTHLAQVKGSLSVMHSTLAWTQLLCSAPLHGPTCAGPSMGHFKMSSCHETIWEGGIQNGDLFRACSN